MPETQRRKGERQAAQRLRLRAGVGGIARLVVALAADKQRNSRYEQHWMTQAVPGKSELAVEGEGCRGKKETKKSVERSQESRRVEKKDTLTNETM